MRKQKLVAAIMAAIIAASMVGCGTTNKEGGGNEQTTAGGESESSLKIGMVFSTGGLGDKNFNDMAYAGLVRAQEDFGIEFDYVEPAAASDFYSLDSQFAETGEYDLLIVLGTDQIEAVTDVAAEFPEQKISIVDAKLEAKGVSSVQTEWSEQTFLSGVIAGLVTKSDMELTNDENVVGIMLGIDLPNLREGMAGFISGVRYVNPECEVLQATVGAFNDPGKAKEIALSMYNRGADIVQHVAGGSGMGVFNAAKEEGRYAFGVGPNQNAEEPNHILLTSARKVDEMIYGEIKALIDGTWEEGIHMSGLKEGTVGYITEDSNIKINADILKIAEETREKIVNGELVPCRDMDELDSWVRENQYQ